MSAASSPDRRGADMHQLIALAHSLRRPVSRGWLPHFAANACLILNVCHADVEGDAVAVWHALRDEMGAGVPR